MIKADIFDFWAACPEQAETHPCDAKVFSRVDHGFDLNVPPIAYTGPLRTAPVVLLFLSPGLGPADREHAETNDGRAWYQTQRSGHALMPTKEEHAGAWTWWSRIVRQFGIEPMQVRDKLAILNIGAYHSEGFHDWHMLTALPSSRAAVNWAQCVLFPRAEAGERIVVCLRSAKLWGLRKSECNGGTLYAPKHGRGGIMDNGPLREEISARVRERIGGPIKRLSGRQERGQG